MAKTHIVRAALFAPKIVFMSGKGLLRPKGHTSLRDYLLTVSCLYADGQDAVTRLSRLLLSSGDQGLEEAAADFRDPRD
jgi:hypothetical protein